MNNILFPFLFFFAGVLIATVITFFIHRNHTKRQQQDSEKLWQERLEAQRRLSELSGQKAEEKLAEQKTHAEQEISALKEAHALTIEHLNAQHEKALSDQVNLLKSEMKAETEALLKAREEELANGNRTNIDAILTPLKESIDKMQNAMNSNAETHVKSNTELRAQLEQAVKDMQERTTAIGTKADSLSQALTGKAKMQGCWGENLLDSILQQEGLIKGKHYTREAANDDHTRPDFLFHFRDNGIDKDLIVDSKVSLTAYANFMNAEDPQEKEKCLTEHLRSIRKHIGELADKDYARKIDPERRFADYVLMFMPIDMALRVALDKEPMLWQEAYDKNVVIVTEQTVTPFLKIIEMTWNHAMQEENNQALTKAAEEMIERVGQFFDSYSQLGEKLRIVCNEYNDGIKKLREGGHSITTSAKKVIKLGMRRDKSKKLAAPTKVVDWSSDKATLQDDVLEETKIEEGLDAE